MILKEEVIPLLMDAAPGFNSMWEEHLEFWNYDEDRGIYNDCAVFARYIVESCIIRDTSEFQDIFETIERLISEGGEEARDIVIVGVLEDIGNIASHYSLGREDFDEWLGPLSHQAWGEIDALYAKGGGSLAGVIRYIAKRDKKRWWQFWK